MENYKKILFTMEKSMRIPTGTPRPPDDYDLDIFRPCPPTFDKNEIIENKNREIKWLYYRRDFWKKKAKTFKNFLIISFCCSGVGLFLILYSLFEFLRQ